MLDLIIAIGRPTPPLAQSVGPLLDPPTRAVLLMSLLAFVLLGVALMAGALIAGRWVRRTGGEDLREPLPLRKRWKPPEQSATATVRAPLWGVGDDPSAAETVPHGATLAAKTKALG